MALLGALALVAFLGVTSARIGHVHDKASGTGQHAQCQFCLHLDRAGGPAPKRVALVPRTPLLVRAEQPRESRPSDCDAPTGGHLPRAPPLADYPLT